MKRKDGRELVTEHPVTAIDRIDYVPREELDIPEGAVLHCRGGLDSARRELEYDDWGGHETNAACPHFAHRFTDSSRIGWG